MKKNKIMSNESGITLVELLAALSILSVVILLAGSTHMFGQRQFISQKESAEASNDLSYALNVMTTDLRKQSRDNVVIEGVELDGVKKYTATKIVINDSGENITYVLDKQKQQLKRNGTVIAEPVNAMTVKVEGTDIGLNITLSSQLSNGQQKEYQTTVTFRRLKENATQK